LIACMIKETRLLKLAIFATFGVPTTLTLERVIPTTYSSTSIYVPNQTITMRNNKHHNYGKGQCMQLSVIVIMDKYTETVLTTIDYTHIASPGCSVIKPLACQQHDDPNKKLSMESKLGFLEV